MKYKYMTACMGLLFIGMALWWHSLRVVELPLTLSREGYPVLHMKIQGVDTVALLGLGAFKGMGLQKPFFENLNSRSYDTYESRNMDGKRYCSDVKIMKHVDLGSFQLSNVFAHEQSPEYSNEIGNFWDDNYEVLFNFVDCKLELSRKNFKIDSTWTVFPYFAAKGGLVIEADIGFGKQKLLLATNSLDSFLNMGQMPHDESDFYEEEGENQFYYASQVLLNEHSFGTQRFKLKKFPQEAGDIRAILGMDFLKDKRLHIDKYRKRVALQLPQYPVIPLNILSKGSNVPYVSAKIGTRQVNIMVDTGAAMHSLLEEHCIGVLNKMNNSMQYVNFKGTIATSNGYQVPTLDLGTCVMRGMVFYASTKEYNKECEIGNQDHLLDGALGSPIIQKYHLFIDIPGGNIYLAKDPNQLITQGIMTGKWIKVPLYWKGAPTISVMTEFGQKQMLIDTGSSQNCIRDEKAEMPTDKLFFRCSDRCIVGGYDLGKLVFNPLPLTPLMQVDGILGMPFLKKHAVYIDYAASMVWISVK